MYRQFDPVPLTNSINAMFLPSQCLSNVSDDGQTTTQHSVYIGYFATIDIWVTISAPVVRKATTQIHRPNCKKMLGNRLRRWANIIPLSSYYRLNQKYNRKYHYL